MSLNVVLSSGEVVPADYSPGQLVKSLVDVARQHPNAYDPAPGRERVYLAAAVNVAAPTTSPEGSSSPTTDPAEPGAAKEGATEAAAATPEPADPSVEGKAALLVPRAFLDTPPFPPVALNLDDTIEAAGVKPNSRVFITFVAPITLRDVTTRTGSMIPTKYTKCSEVRSMFGGISNDYVIRCECKEVNGGQVYGGKDGVYTSDSNLCLAAVHAGVSKPGKGGYFTVRRSGFREQYEGSTANGITTYAYNTRYAGLTITPFLPGDEHTV